MTSFAEMIVILHKLSVWLKSDNVFQNITEEYG